MEVDGVRKRFVVASLLSISLVTLIVGFGGSLSRAADQPTITGQGPIPEDAIRLRILADSDNPADQFVKRRVRDAVNASITGWVGSLGTSNEAKDAIRAHMPELRETVTEVLEKYDASKKFTIKLGQADFPTKMYGDFVYPAGKYDALVISLGDGKGANWWCVLFPPLCFLDFANSEAVPDDRQSRSDEATDTDTGSQVRSDSLKDGTSAADSGEESNRAARKHQEVHESGESPSGQQVEVRSAVGDFLTHVWSALF